jgi:hypothetical protein
MIDPGRAAVALARAREKREEAAELRRMAAQLEASAAVIERTWSPAPERRPALEDARSAGGIA